MIGGDGITANANDIAITAAQTTITSVYNAGLKMGRDAHNLIDFATTDDEVIFRIADVDEIKMAADALAPVTSDGVALGTSSLMWSTILMAIDFLVESISVSIRRRVVLLIRSSISKPIPDN